VHWHGLPVPAGMDGVAGLTQRYIQPGQTFRYELALPRAGTFMCCMSGRYRSARRGPIRSR